MVAIQHIQVPCPELYCREPCRRSFLVRDEQCFLFLSIQRRKSPRDEPTGRFSWSLRPVLFTCVQCPAGGHPHAPRRCLLFVVVASAPSFTQDRRTTLQEMLNGAYGPGLHCVAQFIASTPYILASGFMYQSIFHWLVRLRAT